MNVSCICVLGFLSFKDIHVLVRFIKEDKTGVVPVDRIQCKDTLEYGGSCRVVWSNKIYNAFLICSGISVCQSKGYSLCLLKL